MQQQTADTTPVERLIVVGNGMAGARFIEELLKLAPDRYRITLFGEEPHGNYDRIQLSPLLAGEKTLQQIILNDAQWYASHGVDFHRGVRISTIDVMEKQVTDESGNRYAYDRLVIATGSTPFIPPVSGKELDGVLAYRTIEDVDAMVEAGQRYRHAVVIGGGLLGLEAAYGLKKQGMDVTVVHLADTLMDRQLDAEAAGMLQKTLEAQGLSFRMGCKTEALHGDSRVTSVSFADGSTIPAELVIFAAGIRPNSGLGKAAELVVNRGIVVNDQLQTSADGVYAVGECVEHQGQTYGLVAPLYEQARVLARVLAGDETAAYHGSVTSTRLKVTGVDLFSAGDFSGDAGCDTVVYRDPQTAAYKKLVFRDQHLVGAVAYGDVRDGGWYFQKILDGEDISAIRDYLVFGEALCAEVA